MTAKTLATEGQGQQERTYGIQLTYWQAEEVRAALRARLKELEKISKKLMENGLSTADTEWHQGLIVGTPDAPGALDLLAEQLSLALQAHSDQPELPLDPGKGVSWQELNEVPTPAG